MLCNNQGIGLTYLYTRPTLHGTVNNDIYILVGPRYDTMHTSSAQPNMQSHANVTTSVVKSFQQQALLSNALMSLPVFLGEKNSFNPWVNTAKMQLDIAMTKLTGAPLLVARCL